MNTRFLSLFAAIALAGCATPHAQPSEVAGNQIATVERATIGLSEQFVMHSEHVGDDFLIQIAAPMFVRPPNPDARFPVIYVTDGSSMFGLVSSISRGLPLEGLSEYAYVVAIGYPTDEFMELGALRSRDLVHAKTADVGMPFKIGGGAAFEAFLLQELRPLIEERYPVDPERSVLAGHSLGGLFAAAVLKNDPGAFAAYLIGSPSMQFDPMLADHVRAVADEGGGRRVFIGVGALEGEMIPRATALEDALTASGSTFDVRRVTFENETHVSVMAALITHGLQHVLPPTTQSAKAK